MYAMKGGEKKGIYYGEREKKEIYDVEVAKLTYIIYVKTIDINFLVAVASSFNGKSLALVLVWLVYDMSKGLKNVYVMIFEHPE